MGTIHKRIGDRIMRRVIGLMLLLALSGCTVLSIEPSSHYRTPAKTLVLDDELALTSTGAAYMDFMHLEKGDFLPASFRIDAAGKTIYIDPLRKLAGRKSPFSRCMKSI